MKRRLLAMFIIFLLSVIVLSLAITVCAEENPICCGINSELAENAENTLVQKKLIELNSRSSMLAKENANNEISLYSAFQNAGGLYLSPSVGSVKALVITIDFPDAPISEEKLEEEKDHFYGSHPNLTYDEYMRDEGNCSVRELYQFHSKGKLDFTADVMPPYRAPENEGYYHDGRFESTQVFDDLVQEAIRYYEDNGYIEDYSDYDSDGDGEIDSLIVVHTFTKRVWQNYMKASGEITLNSDRVKLKRFIVAGFDVTPDTTDSYFAGIVAHEYGHMMGLKDNYETYGDNNTLYGTNEIMSNSGYNVFNAYYRYLLGWTEPQILTYDKNMTDINLLAYGAQTNEYTQDSVILIQDKDKLPFCEFYMAEYRAPLFTYAYDQKNGVLIWHVNSELIYGNQFVNSSNYLQPVYKNGGNHEYKYPEFTDADLYVEGDTFSANSSPNSAFYGDKKSAVYIEVIDTDEKIAKVRAGFVGIDVKPSAPTISIQASEDKVINGDSAEWIYTLNDYDSKGELSVEMVTTGSLRAEMNCDMQNQKIKVSKITGEGSVKAVIKPGYLKKNYMTGVLCDEGAVSDILYVDYSPPEIFLSGDREITLEYGEDFVEPGVETKDNLDPNISDKLVVDTSQLNITKPGTYTVYYNVTDHAGLKAEQQTRKVTVLPPVPGVIRYSMTQPTNTDVTATFLPPGEFSADNVLRHTFTENGNYIFEYTDVNGNSATAEAIVDWIDKTPLTIELEYSSSRYTNQDVTVIAVPSKTVTANSVLSHTFTENGEYTFTLTDLAGNTASRTVNVTWIDKTPPEADIEFSETRYTNKPVTVKLTNKSEPILSDTYTFEENGSYVIEFKDLAGNVTRKEINITWIDKTPPEVTNIEYSTVGITNRSVKATVEVSEDVTDDTKLSYYFEKNGIHTFDITDVAGNVTHYTVEVTWIDKTPPAAAQILYSTTELTHDDVVVTIVPSEEVTSDSELTYTFVENETHEFVLKDMVGNTAKVPVEVNWIDCINTELTYSTTELTNQDVTVTLIPSEPVSEDSVLSHTFTENGEYIFAVKDLNGNITKRRAVVTWIDKTPPVCRVAYQPRTPVNGDVQIYIGSKSENGQSSKIYKYTVSENGTYVYTISDDAGNTVDVTANVTWIDRTPPEVVDVQYSTTEPTKENVVVTVTPSEEVTKDTKLTYTFKKNEVHTFVLTDLAGNVTEKDVEVNWIEKSPPKITFYTDYPAIGNRGTAHIYIKYEDIDEVHLKPEDIEIITTGDVKARVNIFYGSDREWLTGEYLLSKNNTINVALEGEDGAASPSGNGTIRIRTKPGSASHGNYDDPGTLSQEIKVDNIRPSCKVTYSPSTFTTGSVTAKIEANEELSGQTEFVYNENVSKYEWVHDLAGNAVAVPIRINWIKDNKPTINYTTNIDDNTVTATVVSPVEIDIAETTHIFYENGSYTFEYKDAEGNTKNITATVNWLHPTGVVTYSPNSPTGGSVTALLNLDKSKYTTINNGGSNKYIFNDNGTFAFKYADNQGNKYTAIAKVSWIDKPSPTPSAEPSEAPSASPTPSAEPSEAPSASPTPSAEPSEAPSASPAPSAEPSEAPSASPAPSAEPSAAPSASPTPSAEPSVVPSASPAPSAEPSAAPSASPAPSAEPSAAPSASPTPSAEPVYNWQINGYENNMITLIAPKNAEGVYIIMAKYNGDYLIDCEIMYLCDLPYGMSYIQMSKDIKAQDGETLKIMLWDSNFSPLTEPFVDVVQN